MTDFSPKNRAPASPLHVFLIAGEPSGDRLGAALMARYMYPEEPDPVAIQRRLRIDVTLPGLELYTYGLFTDSSLLAEYRQGRHHDGHAQGTTTDGGPPGPASATTPSTPSTSRTSS